MAEVVSLNIMLEDNGSVRVEGTALPNKLAAFGMLECAKEAITDYHKAQLAKVTPPTAAERLALLQRGV